jgi:uncharacterized membrane protein HdeD (DUF308 family)
MDGPSLLIVRGIIGLIVGLVAIVWPGITIAMLVAIFAAYAILDGITNLVLGFTRTATHGRSGAQVVQGVIGLVAGVVAVVWPIVTAFALVIFIGAWAVATGALEIVAAIRLRRYIKGEWLLALSGTLSLLFGLMVIAVPGAGAIGIAWILGVYAAAAGIVLITLGVRLRSYALAH